MTFILVGTLRILALVALAQVKSIEFGDPRYYLLNCLAYYASGARLSDGGHRLVCRARPAGRRFYQRPQLGWTIFLVILAAGQIVQTTKP